MAKKQSKTKYSGKAKHKKIVNSHDAFFKTTFSHKDVAQSYIEKFMEQNLVQNIDLQSLTLESTSYITADLEEYFADLVWSAAYKSTQVKIAFLFEHKSFMPPYPDVQLMRYITEHLEKQIKAKEKLNVVIPIIIYHGKDEWQVRPFYTYFEGIDEVLKKYIPSFSYQFTNLGDYTDEELISMGIGKLLNVFLAMMHIRDLQYIRNNFETIFVYAEQYLPHHENFFQTIFVYLFKNIEISSSEMAKIVRTIQSPVKIFAMSTYDLLKQEGKIEGKIEGASLKEREFATSLIISTDFDNEKIAMLVSVTVDYVVALRQELTEK
jgi:predicted transposase/invertase (TIGR01784 family)